MRPAVEQAVAEAIPHGPFCTARMNGDVLCNCTANARRNVLLAKLGTREGYVYLDRR